MKKRFFYFLILAVAFTQALAQSGEESWGWGGEDIPTNTLGAPTPGPARIQPLEEVIARHLLDKDFNFIANVDSIKEYATRSAMAYRYKSAYRWEPEYIELFNDVFAYLDSDTWEDDLKKLPEGDAAFVRIIVYDIFFENVERHYVQIQLSKIKNSSQRDYLESVFHVKSEAEELHTSRWMMGFGIGANFFSNGANDLVNNTPAVDMGFGYCLFGRYCADFHIGGLFQGGLKEDIVQDGHAYSKHDISYTPVEALFRVNVFSSFEYELSVYGGLRLHALECDSKLDDKYKEKYGQTMDGIYSYGYTTGIIAARYFAGNGHIPGIFGIGARLGIATFGDTDLNITGYNWIASLNVLIRVGKVR